MFTIRMGEEVETIIIEKTTVNDPLSTGDGCDSNEDKNPLDDDKHESSNFTKTIPIAENRTQNMFENNSKHTNESKSNLEPSKLKHLFRCIPRTIRWRIHLGLLDLPRIIEIHTENENYMNSIYECNDERIKKQHDRFDKICKQHLWENTALALIEKRENQQPPSLPSKSDDVNKEKKEIEGIGVGEDPLSEIMLMTEAQKQKVLAQRNDKFVTNEDDDRKGNSSWAEFYSSKETIQIIEKDLERLSPTHNIVTSVSKLYDSSFVEIEENSLANKKDLISNLPSNEDTTDANSTDKKQQQRIQLLQQLLFIYSRENPSLGYRQGMHEILSYVFIALEVDFHNICQKVQQPPLQLLSTEYFKQDAYAIFEAIMYHLAPTFDSSLSVPPFVNVASLDSSRTEGKELLPFPPPSSQNKMTIEKIGDEILNIIERLGFTALHKYLKEVMPIPAHLYCIRWIRLMMTREISSISKAMFLWDKMFFALQCSPSRKSLINILEFVCVAMILRVRAHLSIEDHDSDEDNTNDAIDVLMNYAPIDDTKTLWKDVCALIERHLSNQQNIQKKQQVERKSMPEKTSNDKNNEGAFGLSAAIHSFSKTFADKTQGFMTAASGSAPSNIYKQYNRQQDSTTTQEKSQNVYSGRMLRKSAPNSNEQSNNNAQNFFLRDRFTRAQADPMQSEMDMKPKAKSQVQQAFSQVPNQLNVAMESFSEKFIAPSIGAVAPKPKKTERLDACDLGKSITKNVTILENYLTSIHEQSEDDCSWNEKKGTQAPKAVWDALKEINLVGKQLMAQK